MAGVVLLGGAVVWRQSAGSHLRRLRDAAMADPDARVRQAALDSFGEQWLGPHATALLELARQETDPDVITALISLVGLHQWEPADNPALTELRSLVLRWLSDINANEPGVSTESLRFEPAELFTWLEAALGEPVVEVRIHGASGSVLLRPLHPSVADTAANGGSEHR